MTDKRGERKESNALVFFLLQQTEHLHNTVALTISDQITWEREDRDDRPKKTGVIYNDISCLLHCFSITTNLQYLDSSILLFKGLPLFEPDFFFVPKYPHIPIFK